VRQEASPGELLNHVGVVPVEQTARTCLLATGGIGACYAASLPKSSQETFIRHQGLVKSGGLLASVKSTSRR
jgi:hypothetical protein